MSIIIMVLSKEPEPNEYTNYILFKAMHLYTEPDDL